MNKVLLVARREFMYNLRRPAFLFAAFGTPIIILVAMVLSSTLSANEGPTDLETYGRIGYIDNSITGVLSSGVQLDEFPELFVPYDTLESAQADLDAGEIRVYIELPPLYLNNGRVNIYSEAPAPETVEDAIEDFIVGNLATEINSDIPLARIQNSVDEMNIEALDSGRTVNQEGMLFLILMPVVFAIIMMISAMTTSSFLMSGLVEEKTNRIMELLITSVRPMQLMAGKILGLGALGLFQVLVFVVVGVIGLTLAESAAILQRASLPLDLVIVAVIYYVLAYALLSTMLAAIGAVAGSEQESRQISAFITLPFFVPYILIVAFITDPNGTLPTILSIIPITAPLSMLMRFGLTVVPMWQVALSIALLVVTIVLMVWLSARVFRWGMLRYGQKFDLRQILAAMTRRGATVEAPPTATQEVKSA